MWGGQTFRAAFVLACMSAIRAMAAGTGDPSWHLRELLVIFVPILLIGFLSVALPRWTKRTIAPRGSLEVLLVCHAAAFIFGFFAPEASLVLHAVGACSAVAIVMHHSRGSRAASTTYITALIGIHAVAGSVLACVPGSNPAFARICLSAVVLLCLEVGGRIAAALMGAAFQREGLEPAKFTVAGLLLSHRLSATAAVTLWSVGLPSSIPACIAGLLGIVRLILLRPWKVRPVAGVIAVLVGVFCLNAGFLGLAVSLMTGYPVPDAAIIHVWSVGGLGMTAVAVMTSVTRKRAQIPFRPALLASLAYAMIAAAAVLRLFAITLDGSSQEILLAARLGWICAFLCCAIFVELGSRSGPWRNASERFRIP
ncbi:NnrS family protein [Microvirga arabica]|uniref:NnrS family protein n=1 Tax=Microvirga arabica TaxID=1128671 RepID=A0ABV6YHK7_9HYPH